MIDKFFFGLFGAIDCVFEWIHLNFKPNNKYKCSICTCKGKK